MKDAVRIIPTFFLPLVLISGGASNAQAVEVAPFAGFRYGGSFQDATTLSTFEVKDASSYGLLLDFDTEPDKQIEVLLSRQDTQLMSTGPFTGNPLFDLTIDYYHIGGLYMFPDYQSVRPFISGTLGLTRMAPHRSDLTTENYPSLSLGGGAKFYFTKSIGLRFDARAFYTMVNSDSAIFCSGGCTIKVSGSGFIQTEIGAALLMKF
jgi:hypothetical protein